MGVSECLAHLLEDREEAFLSGGGVCAVGKEFGQGPSLHQLHCEKGALIVESAQLINGNNTGVLQPAVDLCLFQKTPHQFGSSAVLFEQDLDGDAPVEIAIQRL